MQSELGRHPIRTPRHPVHADRFVYAWLWTLFGMIFVMLVVGGITRLTGSGLSMVEWRPLIGALPPGSEQEWLAVFDRYKASPQYLEVNSWMQLADFKRIFFWEYIHRLYGRLIGVVAFVPWLYFTFTRRMPPAMVGRTLAAVALGGLQGLLGWYMVKSGLVDRPEVSHLRLAAHLLLAIIVAQWVFWILLDLYFPTSPRPRERSRRRAAGIVTGLALGLLGVVALQIVYGAFMAGTHAGLLFASFPDMNGAYSPHHFFPLDSLAQNLFYSPLAIHWVHRLLGWLLLFFAGGLWYGIYRARIEIVPAWAPLLLFAVISVQFVLGALTALYQVPVTLAVCHQAGGFILMSSATLLAHGSYRAG
jgi:cytochrome c oxidase assembly protein subunit 15